MATIWGTSGDDSLRGTDDADHMRGYSGADLIRGGAGADTLFGEDGADTLKGGDGDDNSGGGIGRDLLVGGMGHDILSGQEGSDTLRGGSGDDTLGGVEGGDGERFRDHMFGGSGEDTFYFHRRDVVDGGAGTDRFILNRAFVDEAVRADFSGLLDGEAHAMGATLLNLEGGLVIASNLHDVMRFGSGGIRGSGWGGDDLIFSDGHNTVNGDSGADTLVATGAGGRWTGGDGDDIFRIAELDAFSDQYIYDLEASDIIDLHRLDANSAKDGNQRFYLVDSPTGEIGEVYMVFDGWDTQLFINVDQDDFGDPFILLQGDQTGFTNFIL